MVQCALVKDYNSSVEWIDFLKILYRLCIGVIVELMSAKHHLTM